jgi:hypothetical protein
MWGPSGFALTMPTSSVHKFALCRISPSRYPRRFRFPWRGRSDSPGASRQAATIEFIELRNRLAHGNLAGIIGFEHNGTPDYSAEAREGARWRR